MSSGLSVWQWCSLNFLGHARFHSFFKRHHYRRCEKAKGVILPLKPIKKDLEQNAITLATFTNRPSAGCVAALPQATFTCWFAASATDDGEG
jgi:hypothetical protein